MKTSLTKLFIIPLEWNAFFAVLDMDAAMFALIKCSGWTGTTVNRKYSSKSGLVQNGGLELERRELGTQAF